MNIKFLGTGGFCDIDLGNSAAYVDLPQGRVLIDCGVGVYKKLKENNLIDTIDYLLITHLHGDHMATMFHLICEKKRPIDSNIESNPLKIFFVDLEQKRLIEVLLGIRFGENNACELISLESINTIRAVDTTGAHAKGTQSFSYVIEDNERIIYFSGDLGDLEYTQRFLSKNKGKDILMFHEVTFNKKSTGHSYYKDLQELTQGIETYCYHCDYTKKPDDCTLRFVADYPEFMI